MVAAVLMPFVVLLAACSSDEETPVPEPRSVTTTIVPIRGADGSEIPAKDLDVLSARIEENARTARLDANTANQLRSVMLRSIGLSAEQTQCVIGQLPPNDDQPVGAITLMSSIPPGVLATCVGGALEPNAAPDLSDVPADEVRAALSGVLTSVWLESGLSRGEVDCMVAVAVSSLDDDAVRDLLVSPEPSAGPTRESIGGCLTRTRVDALIAG